MSEHQWGIFHGFTMSMFIVGVTAFLRHQDPGPYVFNLVVIALTSASFWYVQSHSIRVSATPKDSKPPAS